MDFIITWLKISSLCMLSLRGIDKYIILNVRITAYLCLIKDILLSAVKRCHLNVHAYSLFLIRFKIIWFKTLWCFFFSFFPMKPKRHKRSEHVCKHTGCFKTCSLTFSYMLNPEVCNENNYYCSGCTSMGRGVG